MNENHHHDDNSQTKRVQLRISLAHRHKLAMYLWQIHAQSPLSATHTPTVSVANEMTREKMVMGKYCRAMVNAIVAAVVSVASTRLACGRIHFIRWLYFLRMAIIPNDQTFSRFKFRRKKTFPLILIRIGGLLARSQTQDKAHSGDRQTTPMETTLYLQMWYCAADYTVEVVHMFILLYTTIVPSTIVPRTSA